MSDFIRVIHAGHGVIVTADLVRADEMNAAIAPRRSLTVWWSVFFSPTVYFLLLFLADRFHTQSPPEIFVALLFYLIPPLALLVCGSLVWRSSMPVGRKVGWMLLTLLGMLLQFGILLAIVVAASGDVPTQ